MTEPQPAPSADKFTERHLRAAEAIEAKWPNLTMEGWEVFEAANILAQQLRAPSSETQSTPLPAPTVPGWYECRYTIDDCEPPSRQVRWFDGRGWKQSPQWSVGEIVECYTDFRGPIVPASELVAENGRLRAAAIKALKLCCWLEECGTEHRIKLPVSPKQIGDELQAAIEPGSVAALHRQPSETGGTG